MVRVRRVVAVVLASLACAPSRDATTPELAPRHAPALLEDAAAAASDTDAGAADGGDGDEAPPAGLACLARSYAGVAKKLDGRWVLALDDGHVVPWKKRSEERTEDSPFDLEDNYETLYPKGPILPITREAHNPGRVRVDELFFATYGKSAREVTRALVPVSLGGKTFVVHEKIAAPLRRVAARVRAAMQKDPAIARFFASPGGTFNWRTIAGTRELSMHSWGIAIDLDVGLSNYWRNSPQPLVWTNHYPQSIVDAFEAEGFIWGGRWYYFDTMHFEYRPELVDENCYPKK